MDSRYPWMDFHFLNTTFQNISGAGSRSWINPSLVRFSYRGTKDRSINRTVRAADGIRAKCFSPYSLFTDMFSYPGPANEFRAFTDMATSTAPSPDTFHPEDIKTVGLGYIEPSPATAPLPPEHTKPARPSAVSSLSHSRASSMSESFGRSSAKRALGSSSDLE
jgi:hypothetical protein